MVGAAARVLAHDGRSRVTFPIRATWQTTARPDQGAVGLGFLKCSFWKAGHTSTPGCCSATRLLLAESRSGANQRLQQIARGWAAAYSELSRSMSAASRIARATIAMSTVTLMVIAQGPTAQPPI